MAGHRIARRLRLVAPTSVWIGIYLGQERHAVAVLSPDGRLLARFWMTNARSGSSGVIETLLARRLIEDDPRFGSRVRPSLLATTADFLRLAQHAARTTMPAIAVVSAVGHVPGARPPPQAAAARVRTKRAAS